jgi:plastocyanin
MLYQPATITIAAGDSVVWTNDDGVEHTATGIRNDWETGSLARGTSNGITFPYPGEYAYYCRWHPGMRGTVIVT